MWFCFSPGFEQWIRCHVKVLWIICRRACLLVWQLCPKIVLLEASVSTGCHTTLFSLADASPGQPNRLPSSRLSRSAASCAEHLGWILPRIHKRTDLFFSTFWLFLQWGRDPSWFFAFWDVESFYACREKSVVTPDRLASLAHVWPRSSRRIGEGESRYSVNARPVLLIWFVCLLRLWGVVAQPKPWSIAPAARGLSWTAFCSTCWTEPGTSSACNAASANAIWQRNVFLEKGDYTAKTISLGKLDEDGRNPLKSNVFVLLRSFTFLLHTNNTQQVSRDKPWKKLYKDIYIFSKEGPKVVMAHSETRKLYKKPYKH